MNQVVKHHGLSPPWDAMGFSVDDEIIPRDGTFAPFEPLKIAQVMTKASLTVRATTVFGQLTCVERLQGMWREILPFWVSVTAIDRANR
ncbi:MAG: hypothetical protein AB7P10_13915 [Hydrogenophaga sp.]